jgi:hypothetical protein
MNIDLSVKRSDGLHLYCANGDYLNLSCDNIKQLADEWWNNPEKIPEHIRQNDHFKTCEVCPYRGKNVFCSAMKPLLPFLEALNKFSSYDTATAIYVKDGILICASDVPMQNALQYVVNLALFEYCEDAKQFRKYFQGITPFMAADEVARIIFQNVYCQYKGDKDKVQAEIEKMNYDITNTTTSCVKRLNVLCSSDAFMNAYIGTQATVALMLARLHKYLE